MTNPLSIKNALISVSDKHKLKDSGLTESLSNWDINIYATDSTYDFLNSEGVKNLNKVSSLTGSNEMLNGKVKTLHPRIFAGILFDRYNKEECKEIKLHSIAPIGMTIVDLYPVQNSASLRMDIGGHALIRASIKNYRHVWCVTPKLYHHLDNILRGKTSTVYDHFPERRDFAKNAVLYVRESGQELSNYGEYNG